MYNDKVLELGKYLSEACVVYYDIVNNTENLNICVGMSVDVKNSDSGKSYRYNVKIEKEVIENE